LVSKYDKNNCYQTPLNLKPCLS